MLEGNYKLQGKPQFDTNSSKFWDFFCVLVDFWRVAYPLEVVEWLDTRAFDLAEEKPLREQVKSGLHKSYAFPIGLFRLIKCYWPNAQLMDKEFGYKFKRKFPMFRNSRYT